MSRGDFHGTSTKIHVDQFIINDDLYNSLGNEGMHQKLSMQVLVPGVLWVYSYSNVTQHGFKTSGGYLDLLIWVFHLVHEMGQVPKLIFALVSWDLQLHRLIDIDIIDLDVTNSCSQSAAPIY